MTSNFNSQQWRVLAIDDEADNLRIVRKVLTHEGADVMAVTSIHAAKAALEGWQPSVILLNPELRQVDGADGWALYYDLRQWPHTRNLPIVALTGHALPDALRGVQEAGFDATLLKPFHIEQLLNAIKSAIAGRMVD